MQLVTASEPSPRQRYVLLISGTMNPPHRGHVRIGMAAVAALKAQGHEVVSCLFTPVHDNYMWNKVTAKGDTRTPVFPMTSRVAMLEALIKGEGEEASRICRALDYESVHGAELLEESPGYWAPLMPGGYLRTVPTAALINHVVANLPELQTPGTRLGLAFGVDNLAGMASWNRPGSLLARGDLILFGRAMGEVQFKKDPSELFSAISSLEVCANLPVTFDGKTIFGDEKGSFKNQSASGSSALSLLPALGLDLEDLSSTRIRDSLTSILDDSLSAVDSAKTMCIFDGAKEAPELLSRILKAVADAKRPDVADAAELRKTEVRIAKCLATLAQHGYTVVSMGALFRGSMEKAATLERLGSSAKERGEFVCKDKQAA